MHLARFEGCAGSSIRSRRVKRRPQPQPDPGQAGHECRCGPDPRWSFPQLRFPQRPRLLGASGDCRPSLRQPERRSRARALRRRNLRGLDHATLRLALVSGDRRRIILATNIAETSITIEGVDLVIDGGLERVLEFDVRGGINRLETKRISRQSADQRAGRAGRLGPGRTLRLWTRAEHTSLAEARTPEIERVDLWRGRLPFALSVDGERVARGRLQLGDSLRQRIVLIAGIVGALAAVIGGAMFLLGG